MRLSILIPALHSRRKMLAELTTRVEDQVRRVGDVELLVMADDGELPSGEKRNRLIRQSRGDYFCQLDDDDMVQKNYVAALYEACGLGVDVVTFNLERIGKDRPRQVHHFSLHHRDRQPIGVNRVGMRANHLGAWRRDIGTLVSYPPVLGYNDDVFWYDPLIESGLVTREHHIDDVLYTYLYDPVVTRNQLVHQIALARSWSAGGVPCYLIDERPYVGVMGQDHYRDLDAIQARDGNGTVYTFCRHALPQPYFIARTK